MSKNLIETLKYWKSKCSYEGTALSMGEFSAFLEDVLDALGEEQS